MATPAELTTRRSIRLLQEKLIDALQRAHALGWGSYINSTSYVSPEEIGIDRLVWAFLPSRAKRVRLTELLGSLTSLVDLHCGDCYDDEL